VNRIYVTIKTIPKNDNEIIDTKNVEQSIPESYLIKEID